MKKLGLLALVFALVGCNNGKNVTEKMLVGTWDCAITQQVAVWKNGAFQNYGNETKNTISLTYKMYSGTLIMSYGEAKNVWMSSATNLYLFNKKEITIVDNRVMMSDGKMTYISDDEFKVNIIYDTQEKELPEQLQEERNIKEKAEYLCVRAK